MITKRQKQILEYIKDYIDNNGYSPTLKEICDYFGLKSVATMHEHINNIVNEGFLVKSDGGRVDIACDNSSEISENEIPFLGYVTAGKPIHAITDSVEHIEVPSYMKSSDCYALRVKGNSMIDEHIMNGDIVIVENSKVAYNGQTIVALVDDYEVTLKKFYNEKNGNIRLQPANSDFEPIILSADRVQIQGILVGIIRDYTKIN
ncbi:MAG: transcriptional repressor LexA [Candidatus Muirbacterium halophilum]|nr:transcriptional repressor LexA [Candidatus Muirbacterium halophilum]MCK9477418.1 transcriptional repressor LexA [Candidatus Muirbacterium halophilum]